MIKVTKNNKSLLFGLVILLLIVVWVYLTRANKPTVSTVFTTSPTPISTSQNLKTFKSSEIMDFTIETPRDYQVVEKYGLATLTSSKGKIIISQNATNYDNLSDFLKDNRGTSYTNITNKRYLNINNLESVSGFIGEEKIYFIYVDYTVYLISSKTGALFSDLDQIAQSFRYTP
ncbi:hypothetical protein A3A76_04255 [Candidatus Woesebacteria bacterium RIFCSPLOWO2_01_FULL_39_23]|uniref:DUF4367 domain-containing protein n=1 Tax=Candidatus Woesebacteria bacterium RIFCSPHIGHO2_01_FULL_40_22 TaxID=1802499 RepID=A0A1F7YHH6_9BACT|nr:MAG: hypothetical protein A2141_01820 [Candidatus Woesebacteria bacterium RBG_16_40_11]OGM25965.1 MAG: hypothetical protein A2628_00255 [Candidatus Woesebacteria bacterium RIFCSPHIGHO2_01_FULL_40_22]OGM38077.1 MAG: hypothetical protein A3E41_03340 [Candidatus Woesebacteria bacterium RIFCSPHIGHO2_12_FULL_38_9]OGM61814.1 MAG: hypothetical protein A3A76_04255 [Candidatus Woesebacteria bacterium RIFCSPLOWO2_01_FULL_39_23]